MQARVGIRTAAEMHEACLSVNTDSLPPLHYAVHNLWFINLSYHNNIIICAKLQCLSLQYIVGYSNPDLTHTFYPYKQS